VVDNTGDEPLGIVISRYCTAECAHCGSTAGPSRTGRIDRSVLARALAAAPIAGYGRVAFTGGEPLAHRALTIEGVRIASGLGLHTTVCTNAFWADGDERCDEVLDQLVEAGLDRLQLSTDRWHVTHIPASRVVRAAERAARRPLAVQVAIPAGRADWVAFELLGRFRHIEGIEAFTHPAHAVGRGEDLPTGVLQPAQPQLAGCHLAGHHEIDVDGRVSICPTSADFGPRSVLRAGDATVDDLDVLVGRSRRQPLPHVIARWGPVGVARLAGWPPGIEGRFVHDCQLCRKLHQDDEVVTEINHRHGLDLLKPREPDELERLLVQIGHLIESAEAETAHETMVQIR
jgi:Zn-finger protein